MHLLGARGKTVSAQQDFDGLHVWGKPGLSGYLVCLVHLVYLVCLVHLVYLVRLVQPNKQDKLNKPNKRDRPNEPDRPNKPEQPAGSHVSRFTAPGSDFFSILLGLP